MKLVTLGVKNNCQFKKNYIKVKLKNNDLYHAGEKLGEILYWLDFIHYKWTKLNSSFAKKKKKKIQNHKTDPMVAFSGQNWPEIKLTRSIKWLLNFSLAN